MNKIGILGVNKPSGMTSFDVVRLIKKITGIKKIGHGGTLDPMATGVLPVLLNEATSFFDVLLNSVKIYETKIQLGAFTDTDDKDGEIIKNIPVDNINLQNILEKISLLTGEISQIPPVYSALKINGKRACDLARSGKDVHLQPRKTTVYSWDNVSYDPNSKVINAVIKCSSGTYIRSLARDLAEYLGTGGYLIELHRTLSGGINIADTVTWEELKHSWSDKMITPEKALFFLPSIEWDGDLEYLIHGKPLSTKMLVDDSPEGIYRLMYRNKVVSLLEYRQEKISYKKNLAPIYKDMLMD